MLFQITYSLFFASAIMFVVWLIQYKTDNAGFVDVSWAFCTALIGIYFAYMNTDSLVLRNYIVAIMIGLWGFRLGYFLLKRVLNENEDRRYQYMKQYCGKYAQLAMFLFFQLQATWAVLFALTILAVVNNKNVNLQITDYVAIVIWCISLSGEYLADWQLSQFRKLNNNSKVCKIGLWHYSRHPNYFFEWLHWGTYIFLSFGSPLWWLSWLIMFVVLIFLVKITGIPYTEQNALRTKGDAYREYQQTTSAFLLLPPKKSSS